MSTSIDCDGQCSRPSQHIILQWVLGKSFEFFEVSP
jgi:hypothetical protein